MSAINTIIYFCNMFKMINSFERILIKVVQNENSRRNLLKQKNLERSKSNDFFIYRSRKYV